MYSRKQNYDGHFEKPRSKSGGPNPCFKSDPKKRKFCRSVLSLKEKQTQISFGLKRSLSTSNQTIDVSEGEPPCKKNQRNVTK